MRRMMIVVAIMATNSNAFAQPIDDRRPTTVQIAEGLANAEEATSLTERPRPYPGPPKPVTEPELNDSDLAAASSFCSRTRIAMGHGVPRAHEGPVSSRESVRIMHFVPPSRRCVFRH